jgi:ATP-dependent RNA helicase DHX37/DHR1
MQNSLFDEQLQKLIGKEVTEDLLKSMKIYTIEDYRKHFKDDEVSKKKKTSKKEKEKIKVSKSKMKEQARKKEMVLNKKFKNDMRSQILESLEKHKAFDVEHLDSAKNLGKKRKISKDLKEMKIEENQEPEVEEKQDLLDVDDISLSDESSFDQQKERSEINSKIQNSENTENIDKPIQNSSLEIDPNLFSTILEEKIKNRTTQGLLLELDDQETVASLNLELSIPDKSKVILVKRDEAIQNERINLPIVKYEHEIMDKINNNLVTVICGETGSGKSTQIPQFLYEYGYTNSLGGIVVTQPRRVAAISLANRVSNELNTKIGEEVGYQVRYDSTHYSNKTVIKYVTDGILLKELESDKLLLKYSVVMIDEAHERTINTDIIIGLLSKLVRMRYLLAKNKVRLSNSETEIKPLRLVIMSATMRVDEFLESSIFKPHIVPSFIKIEARQFPVTIHHAKRTPVDYIEEAFKLCCKIHHKLPQGGVLVFLTGKREIQVLCEKLSQEFEKKVSYNEEEENIDMKNDENQEIQSKTISDGNIELNKNLENLNQPDDEKKPSDVELDSNLLEENKIMSDNNENDQLENENLPASYKPYIILPLYSSLPQEQQMKVFEKIPSDKRLIVIATNVAETSLTIPGIRYVVDSGRCKKREFKSGLSFSTFKIEWISQASAEQRSGRAGRTGPGYCYRLYSNGLFAKMDRYTEPQIVSSPLDQMILYLKSLNISDISKFPFLTFPNKKFVEKTLRHLIVIGALKTDEDSQYNIIKNFIATNLLTKDAEKIDQDYKDNTLITDIGKLMIKFPVPPKYGKIIILSNKLGLIYHAIVLVAIMNVENLFIFDNQKKSEIEEVAENETSSGANSKKKNQNNLNDLRNLIDTKLLNPFSDAVTYLNLILSLLKLDYEKYHILNSFCNKYHLNLKKVKEMLDIIEQIVKIAKILFNDASLSMINYKNKIDQPSSHDQNLLMQILLSGFIDNLARRRVIYDKVGNQKDNTSNASARKVIYECNENNEECQIHPNSLLSKTNPDFIIYKEIIRENKTFLLCNTVIKTEWLYNLGGEIISSNLVKDSALNEPFYDMKDDSIYCYVDLKYGYKSWDIPKVKVTMSNDHEGFYRYLARFILEGKIFKELAEFEKFMNAKPKMITNQISILPKVTMLVNALKFSKVGSRQDILNIWKQRKSFLMDAYLNWFDDNKLKDKIRVRWPFVKLS